MIPAWFQADVYFQNKLAGGDAEALNAALLAAGYSLDIQGLYRHFVDCGNSEGVSPNPLFDTWQHLRNKTADAFGVENPTDGQIAEMAAAIAAAGMTAWEHYCQYGWLEGISPSDGFDGNQYLRDKSSLEGGALDTVVQDFQEAGFNPITHYYAYGRDEGLSIKPVVLTIPEWFEWEVYFQNKLTAMGPGWSKEGLKSAFLSAGYSLDTQGMWRHFRDYGNDEDVSPNSVFDPQGYLIAKTADFFGVENPTAAQMADVAARIANAKLTLWEHYYQYGWDEGINPSATFDSSQYIEAAAAYYGITVDQMSQKLKDEKINPVMHYLMYDIGWTPSGPVTNTPPVITGIPAQTTQLSVGDTINLADFTVSDADGGLLTVTQPRNRHNV
ncbi:hypothetical protein LJC22_07775 [Desulfosarcina sp. OttesenSCG-928-G10]|nr:hypothetical protein [Desulfosarcina sp. OttesenSCG-928-G10]MDL2322263.1 hypothetical protein [Desulfosarcina sp. OttesenSCG-928-B08]